MKDQYFGDFGDYQKFSLLKMLRDVSGLKITVHWMKTRNDGGADGKHIAYLKKPGVWRSRDPKIFDFLKGHVDNRKRELALYEKSAHAIGIRFVNDHIENARTRSGLLDAICSDKNSNLIFFDPDNGIEVKSMKRKSRHKYVLWDEAGAAFNSGKSVLIYQHFGRINRNAFIEEKRKEFAARFDADTFVIRVKHSVYFLLAQESHKRQIQKGLKEYSRTWALL